MKGFEAHHRIFVISKSYKLSLGLTNFEAKPSKKHDRNHSISDLPGALQNSEE
jgi:hypothetical protein